MTSDNDSKKPESSPTVLGGADSLTSKMMRQMVESAPSTAEQVDLSSLPDVKMPSLEDIEVTVPAQAPVTEDDIFQRFQMMYYNTCVERKYRAFEEPIELGDEILLDMIGYLEGRIIPHSAKEDLKFILEENSFLDGFGASLVGATVGETKVVTIPRPIEDEFGLTKNLTAAFVVQIKSAATLSYPDPEAPETLAKFGLGDMSLEDLYKAIGEKLTAERASAMFVEGMNLALNAVANRIQSMIPDELIKTQIRSMWNEEEGHFLMEKGVARADMDAALEGWLADPDIQAEARQKLKVTQAILTYAANEDQEVQAEELDGFVEEFSKSLGIDPEAWRASVADDQDAQIEIFDTYLYVRTALHMISKISIKYGE